MISKEQVEHIAQLAKIELTEKEKEKFSQELSSILDYIDKLNRLNVEKIEPVSQVTGLKNVFREDDLQNKEDVSWGSEILKLAPTKRGDYFKVPKIFE